MNNPKKRFESVASKRKRKAEEEKKLNCYRLFQSSLPKIWKLKNLVLQIIFIQSYLYEFIELLFNFFID